MNATADMASPDAPDAFDIVKQLEGRYNEHTTRWLVRRHADGEHFIGISSALVDSFRNGKFPGRVHLDDLDPDRQLIAASEILRSTNPRGADGAEESQGTTKDGQMSLALQALLNHENLVSLVGRKVVEPIRAGADAEARADAQSLLIWDYCDAGNLGQLMQLYLPDEALVFKWLPESLCWHVLKSVARAIVYLHDGERYFFDAGAPPGTDPKSLRGLDRDWNPILHRRIGPENIFFQHPRGRETYGMCKLGNFGDAFVTAHYLGKKGERLRAGIAMAPQPDGLGYDTLNHMRHSLLNCDQEPNKIPWTAADEFYNLASVVLRMMTTAVIPNGFQCEYCKDFHAVKCGGSGARDSSGTGLGQQDSCFQKSLADKGCGHVIGGCVCVLTAGWCHHQVPYLGWAPGASGQPTTRKCSETTINLEHLLARCRYSRWLRDVLANLFSLRRTHDVLADSCGRAAPVLRLVETGYAEWKKNTVEGRDYVDVDDVMEAQWRDELAEEAEAGREERALLKLGM